MASCSSSSKSMETLLKRWEQGLGSDLVNKVETWGVEDEDRAEDIWRKEVEVRYE